MTMEDASAMTEASGLTGNEAAARLGETTRPKSALPSRGHGLADALRRLTIEAPLQSLTIAFLLGIFVARRR